MTIYNISIAKKTFRPGYFVYVGAEGTVPPEEAEGATSLGTFEHVVNQDTLPGTPETDVNHVLFHHVQERLYHTDFSTLAGGFFPDNIIDMQSVDIILYDELPPEEDDEDEPED